MANPTAAWDKVPVYGWYFELDGTTPKIGTIELKLAQRVNSVDGRNIFPGGTIKATLGGTDNDTAVMNQVRSAMRAADQAAVVADGGTFDGAAWDTAWDARVPAAFFTSFPASDDPDIVQGGFQVMVTEKLNGDPGGKVYPITPLLSMLDPGTHPVPGLNLGTVDVPPGSPSAPAPIYQKGEPGGVAPLDSAGLVPLVNLPDGIGGGTTTTWATIDKPAVVAAGATAADARAVIDAASTADVGAKADEVDLLAHTSAKNNPHGVTAGQIGLGAVSNTSDADKPVSTAQAAVLAAKADLVNGTVPAVQLPSYVDDVLDFATADSSGFPATGESGKIYIATQATPTPTQWRWSANTSTYQQMVSSPGSTDAVPEGAVNKYFTDARAQAANAPALATRLNWRGDYVDGGTYAINDVVNSPGFGSYKCLQAHTASGPAPDIESPFWHLLGSNVVIGTDTGTAADGGATAAALTAKLDKGYAGAVAGTTFTVLWVAGSGWPARPTTRTDVYVHWVDVTGESTDTDTPSDIVTGDRVIRIDTGAVGTSGITVRSVTSNAPVGAIDYQTTPIALTAPSGIAIGDYYLVAVCFGSLPIGSDFVVPAGFTRLTPAIASGQDFAVFGRPIGTSADVTAVASTNWAPNTHTATRGVVVGVALEGVGSVGTATAITYSNPISSPYTLTTATGDATFQVMYTGDSSTSTHTTHASVGGTLLVQAIAKSASTDPTPDNVLSISMNGTGVTLTPGATYGGATNIPMTAA